jgi:hypothetical protein
LWICLGVPHFIHGRIYGISACLLAPDLQTLLLLCDMGAIYGARVVSW